MSLALRFNWAGLSAGKSGDELEKLCRKHRLSFNWAGLSAGKSGLMNEDEIRHAAGFNWAGLSAGKSVTPIPQGLPDQIGVSIGPAFRPESQKSDPHSHLKRSDGVSIGPAFRPESQEESDAPRAAQYGRFNWAGLSAGKSESGLLKSADRSECRFNWAGLSAGKSGTLWNPLIAKADSGPLRARRVIHRFSTAHPPTKASSQHILALSSILSALRARLFQRHMK